MSFDDDDDFKINPRIYAIPAVILLIAIIIFIIKCCLQRVPENDQSPKRFNVRSWRQRGHGQTYRYRPVEIPSAPSSTQEIHSISGTAVVATPVVQPPYPVEALHPTPHAPPPAGYAHNPPYPTHAPHPVPGAAPYPPMTTPYPPAAAPYPPAGPPVGMAAPYPDYSANPPTYSEAVSQAPVRPPPNTSENYAKQSPYNPNY